jgi:DNA processing protein
MSAAPENAALVLLLRHGARSAQTYADLVEEAGSALEVLEREGIQQELFGPDVNAVADEIEAWERDGIRLVSVLDPGYPENLRAVYDRPPLLFVTGALEPDDERALAVIGSRRASGDGLDRAGEIAGHLAENGYTVVSGLAAGIDTAAHTAALARHSRTVAVIGTGLHHAYPPQNAALQRTIGAEGAVVSQFFPDSSPSRRSFPMRNAVMSGISLATVIVEASHTSGARIQARLALAQGRRVFLRDDLLRQDWAQELATRPGTHVFRKAAEITETIERVTATDALVG